MIDCYQQVHIWKSVEKENHPQGLKEITAQEALSYSTGIQIMEEEGEIECSKELDMQMANTSENIQ